MKEIVGVSLSRFHDSEDQFELLIAYADGREVGHEVSRRAALAIHKELYENLDLGATTPPPQAHVAGDLTCLKPIPIEAAKRIAKEFGYDQVLIYARRCHDTPEPHGEHMTTYGRNREHCDVAARIGDTLKKFMGWEV